MRTSRPTIGLYLFTTPPLLGNRLLASFARLSRLDVLWVTDQLAGANSQRSVASNVPVGGIPK